MPNDYFNTFAEFGDRISDAIMGPVKMRLALQEKEETRKREQAIVDIKKGKFEQDKEKTARELEQRKAVAQAMREKGFPESAARAYEAGEDYSDIVKALRSGPQPDKKKARYQETFDLGNVYVQKVQQIMKPAAQAVQKAMESGDKAQLITAKENYTKLYQAQEEALKRRIDLLTESLDGTAAAQLFDVQDKMLAELSPQKLDIFTETMLQTLNKTGKLEDEILTELKDSNDEFGLGIDISGIASGTDIKKYVVAGLGKHGGLDEANVTKILEETDPEELEDVANDDNIPMPYRKLAGARAIKLRTRDAIQGKAEDKVSKMARGQKLEDVRKLRQSKNPKAQKAGKAVRLPSEGRLDEFKW